MSTGLLTMSSAITIKTINTQRSTTLGLIILIPEEHELHTTFTQKCSFHITDNTIHVHDKDQYVNVALLQQSYENIQVRCKGQHKLTTVLEMFN